MLSDSSLCSVQVPNMCPRYQVGIYNITIYDDNNHNIIHYFVPTEYTQNNLQEQELIVKEVKSGLIVGGYYIVEVTVETGGVVHSQNKTFSMLTYIYYKPGCYQFSKINTDTLFNGLTCTGKGECILFI